MAPARLAPSLRSRDVAIFLGIGVLATIVFERLPMECLDAVLTTAPCHGYGFWRRGSASLLQSLTIPGLVFWIVRLQSVVNRPGSHPPGVVLQH